MFKAKKLCSTLWCKGMNKSPFGLFWIQIFLKWTLISKMAVKINFRIKTKNHAVNPEMRFLTKLISKPNDCATAFPTAWVLKDRVGGKYFCKGVNNFPLTFNPLLNHQPSNPKWKKSRSFLHSLFNSYFNLQFKFGNFAIFDEPWGDSGLYSEAPIN